MTGIRGRADRLGRGAVLALGLCAVLLVGAVLAGCDGDDGADDAGATRPAPAASTGPRDAGASPESTAEVIPEATPATLVSPQAGETPLTSFDTSVAVSLSDYEITVDRQTVPAGRIRFIATNVSATVVHELVVLKIQPDGSFQERGSAQSIDPQQGGSVTLTMEPGSYQLACQIKAGESGSQVDHYIEGQFTEFTVE
jgi:hypothetical protein